MHWLRAIGGALWLAMLAFGMTSTLAKNACAFLGAVVSSLHTVHAGSPWPHVALLGVLLFGMARSPRGPPTLLSLACLCLLLVAAFLALLQLRGLRMVMRLDGQGKLGMALIHHGPTVHGLAPGAPHDTPHARTRVSSTGSVLVASEGLHDGGIFARSVVLIVDHCPTRGSRGVVLTAPLHGLEDPLGSSGALRHMVGGPVGAPGSSHPEEVLLHTAVGVRGARQLLPRLPSGPPPPPPALRGSGGWMPKEHSPHAVGDVAPGGGAPLFMVWFVVIVDAQTTCLSL